MAGFRMELEGKEAALTSLADAARRAEKPRDLYEAVGLTLVESTDRRFETETGPDGSPWPKSLRAILTGGKTLTDTAFLRSSIAFEASDGGVAVGTNAIYAAIHQLGGVIEAKTPAGLHFQSRATGDWVRVESVTMPARPFLGLDDEDAMEIEGLAADWIGLGTEVEGAGAAGGVDVSR